MATKAQQQAILAKRQTLLTQTLARRAAALNASGGTAAARSGTPSDISANNAAAQADAPSNASVPSSAGTVVTKTAPATTHAQQQATLAKRRQLLAQRNANRATKGQAGTNATSNGTSTDTTVGSTPLSPIASNVSDMSGASTSTSPDTSAIQSALDALSAQVSSDEQTLSQQQTTLDGLANSSGNAATSSTTSTTSGISGFLTSTTGKVVLLGVLAVGGWFYLKKKKSGSDTPAPLDSYEEEGRV